MYPFSFDEFLMAQGMDLIVDYKKKATRDVHSSVVREALHLLALAGLITPVKHTDGTGVPLGAEESNNYVKYLFFDLGVMLTMLETARCCQ